MDRIVLHPRVGTDGVLHLSVPLGASEAGREVEVTIEAAAQNKRGPQEREEWRRFVMETAGSWQGDFERPEQGEYEQRDELP